MTDTAPLLTEPDDAALFGRGGPRLYRARFDIALPYTIAADDTPHTIGHMILAPGLYLLCGYAVLDQRGTVFVSSDDDRQWGTFDAAVVGEPDRGTNLVPTGGGYPNHAYFDRKTTLTFAAEAYVAAGVCHLSAVGYTALKIG